MLGKEVDLLASKTYQQVLSSIVYADSCLQKSKYDQKVVRFDFGYLHKVGGNFMKETLTLLEVFQPLIHLHYLWNGKQNLIFILLKYPSIPHQETFCCIISMAS